MEVVSASGDRLVVGRVPVRPCTGREGVEPGKPRGQAEKTEGARPRCDWRPVASIHRGKTLSPKSGKTAPRVPSPREPHGPEQDPQLLDHRPHRPWEVDARGPGSG